MTSHTYRKGKPPRLWQVLSWLANWSWERSFGIDIDQDGGVAGSGIMLRLESPFAHRRWLYGWIHKITPEWMREQHREDISDVLLASLLVRPMLGMIPTVSQGDYTSHLGVTWTEDPLNPQEPE